MTAALGVQSIDRVELDNRRVLVRLFLGPPVNAAGELANSGLLRTSLPTLEHARGAGARVVVAADLPAFEPGYEPPSLEWVGTCLSEMTGLDVLLPDDAVGDAAKKVIAELRPGQLCLLENLARHEEEERDEESFAAKLARFTDVYVNDAFGACHRRTASLCSLPRLVPERAAGLALLREVEAFTRLSGTAKASVLVVLGGEGDGENLDRFEALLERAGTIACAGAIGALCRAARRSPASGAALEPALLSHARTVLDRAERRGVDVLLLEGGESTDQACVRAASSAKATVVWGHLDSVGPASESGAPSAGLLSALAEVSAFTVMGGDDTRLASAGPGIERIDHVSLGGDNGLALWFGSALPGLEPLFVGDVNP
jgi:phosphoglycerate kinase